MTTQPVFEHKHDLRQAVKQGVPVVVVQETSVKPRSWGKHLVKGGSKRVWFALVEVSEGKVVEVVL